MKNFISIVMLLLIVSCGNKKDSNESTLSNEPTSNEVTSQSEENNVNDQRKKELDIIRQLSTKPTFEESNETGGMDFYEYKKEYTNPIKIVETDSVLDAFNTYCNLQIYSYTVKNNIYRNSDLFHSIDTYEILMVRRGVNDRNNDLSSNKKKFLSPELNPNVDLYQELKEIRDFYATDENTNKWKSIYSKTMDHLRINNLTDLNSYNDWVNENGKKMDVYDVQKGNRIQYTDVVFKSKRELQLMAYEILARKGYDFTNNSNYHNKEYFDKLEWYNPRFSDVQDQLTEIERENLKYLDSF